LRNAPVENSNDILTGPPAQAFGDDAATLL
jgi:hypothetical protein